MKEDFNHVVVLDFSKFSDDDLEKVKSIIRQVMPITLENNFNQAFGKSFEEAIENGFKKKEIILESVLSKLFADSDIYHAAECLIDAYPGAAVSVILRTIALMMDENYPDHISNCETVYYHSFLDGKIHSIPTNTINKKAWKYFAAFRTQEDAVKAIKLTQAVIRYFSEQED